MGKRYAQVRCDEWVMPVMSGYKLACCDCGLVHAMDFKFVRDSGNKLRVMFRARRYKRATAALRREAAKRSAVADGKGVTP